MLANNPTYTAFSINRKLFLLCIPLLYYTPVFAQTAAQEPPMQVQIEGPLQIEGIQQLQNAVNKLDQRVQALASSAWEYRFLQRNRLQSMQQEIAELGQQGWELVAATQNEGFIFKRRLR